MRKKRLLPLVALLLILATVFAAPLCAFAADADGENEIQEVTCVLDNCDSTTNYVVERYPDTTNYVEGTASWHANNEAGRVTARFLDLDTSKLPAFEDAYLEFYYYVYDETNIRAGQIELSSSGYEDVEEINFDVSPRNMTLKNGWNFVSLKLTDFKDTGNFDYSRLNYFRFYMVPAKYSSFECNLDYLVITDTCHLDAVAESGIKPKSTPYDTLSKITADYEPPAKKESITGAVIVLSVGGVLLIAGGGFLVYMIIGRKKDEKN